MNHAHVLALAFAVTLGAPAADAAEKKKRLAVGSAAGSVVIGEDGAVEVQAPGAHVQVEGEAADDDDEGGAAAPDDGGALEVTGNGRKVALACKTPEADVSVTGNGNEVTVRGDCRTVTVSGNDQRVTLEGVQAVVVTGTGNVVRYLRGKGKKPPRVTRTGVDNRVERLAR